MLGRKKVKKDKASSIYDRILLVDPPINKLTLKRLDSIIYDINFYQIMCKR